MKTSFRKIEEKDDLALIATGIYNTDNKFFNTLFKDKKTSIKVLYQLITSKYHNPYHKDFITIVYDENIGEIAGFMISYMGRQIDLNSVLLAYEAIPQVNLSSIILDNIMSFIFSSKIIKSEYYLGNLFVFQKYRNKGYGSKLVEKSKQKARVNNARNILLDVDYNDRKLLKFYQKRGFKKFRSNYHKLMGLTFGTVGLKCELRE